jgi:4-hydroxy-4-methyl-2-oxoglutarate aldolase
VTPVVVRNLPRVAPDIVTELKDHGVAIIHEAMGRLGLMKTYMRPIYAGACAAGNAVTVLAQPGDNWMLHVAIEQVWPGDMLVVAVGADNTDGMFVELLATSPKARGGFGLVIDAGCCDVRTLTERTFRYGHASFKRRQLASGVLGLDMYAMRDSLAKAGLRYVDSLDDL